MICFAIILSQSFFNTLWVWPTETKVSHSSSCLWEESNRVYTNITSLLLCQLLEEKQVFKVRSIEKHKASWLYNENYSSSFEKHKMKLNFLRWMHTVHMETHKSSGFLPYTGTALTIFMASIVKNAAIHYVSILPNFNFYGLDNNHPAITSSDLEAVSWSHSIFGKCAFCKN